jgi:redox-sensitive bicupin YhaK (pirin superfamily)
VKDIVTEPQYLDVTLSPGSQLTLPTPAGHTVLAYVIEGEADFCPGQARDGYEVEGQADPACDKLWGNGSLIVFEDGDHVVVSAGESRARFLLMSGKPIREPVAWYGPIVMNTAEELELAFEAYRNGTFLKHQSAQ